ncbi:MAG: hypothetical protein AAF738_08125 [Bacteroidota bacterium]
METALHVFTPDRSTEYWYLAIAGVVFLAAIVALYLLMRQTIVYEKRNQQRLFQMLTAFVAVIAFGVNLGLIYTIRQLEAIQIFERSISTSYGRVAFEDLKAVYLQEAAQRSFVSPDIEINKTQFLYVEEKSGKAYIFSPDNYDVRSIVHTLRPMLEE